MMRLDPKTPKALVKHLHLSNNKNIIIQLSLPYTWRSHSMFLSPYAV
jgi:hypothetical protein